LVGSLSLLAAPLVNAQPSGKVYRIGLLTTYYRPDDIGPVAFRQELRRLGWIEGENIVIEVRSAEGKAESLSELAADLVRLKVGVITAMGDLAAVPASQATRTIPIVAGSADPVGIGLVTNLARPEGNVTGLHIQAAETAGKRLQLLKEVVPTVSRVAVLWNATHRGKRVEFGETQVAAQALGVELQWSKCGLPTTSIGRSWRSAQAGPARLSRSPSASPSRTVDGLRSSRPGTGCRWLRRSRSSRTLAA
jgi:putative ABC transport system substrate-binding protein